MENSASLIDWLALPIAIAAIVISFAAYRFSRRAAEAQTVAALIAEYATPEMEDALQKLQRWKQDYSQEVREALRTVASEDEAGLMWKTVVEPHGAEEINTARRRLHWYYKKTFRLYEIGYLSRKAMQIVTDTNGYRLLFDVVWPLSKLVQWATIGPARESRFEWFANLESKFPPPKAKD